MKIRLRLLAGTIIFTGAALLGTAKPAYSTMSLDMFNPLDDGGRKFCCAVDTNGDRVGDTWCCYTNGCRVDATGCQQAS